MQEQDLLGFNSPSKDRQSSTLNEPSVEIISAPKIGFGWLGEDTSPSPTFDLAKIRSRGSFASRNRLSDGGLGSNLRNQQKQSLRLK